MVEVRLVRYRVPPKPGPIMTWKSREGKGRGK